MNGTTFPAPRPPSWARLLARSQSSSPRGWWSVVALVTALALLPIAHARFSADLTDLLPEDSPSARALRRFRAAFGQGDQLVVVALANESSGSASAADSSAHVAPAQWIASLRERLATRPEIAHVEGGPLESLTRFATTVLPSAAVAFLTPDEAAKLRATLSKEGLERAFQRDARLLEQSPGLETSELVRRDPLGLLREVVAERARGFLERGGPIGDDRFALLTIVGRRPAQELAESRKLVEAVDSEIARLGVPSSLRLLKTGGYAIAVDDESRIREDLGGSTLSSIGFVLLMAWLAHRRFAPVLFTSIPLFVGIGWGYALFLLLRGGITMITAAGAAMLVGLGDDFGVHLYSEYTRARHEGLDAATAKRVTIERAGPRVAVAALTSVACFVAFALTGFRGLADLGLLAGLGLLAILVAFLVLFPLLLRRHEPHEGRTPISLLCDWIAAALLRGPKIALASAAVISLAAAALLLVSGLPPFVGDARLLHPENSAALDALAELDRVVHRPLVPWVVLAESASGDADELATRFAQLDARLAPLVAEGVLASYELPTRVLPPTSAQLAAFEALTSSVASSTSSAPTSPPLVGDEVAKEFHAAAESAGFDAAAFAPLEHGLRDNVERASRRAVLTLDELHRLGAGELADTFFRRDRGSLVAAAFLFPTGGLFPGESQNRLVGRVRAAIASDASLALTGFPVVAAELAERVRQDFRGVTWLSIGVVLVLVFAGCRSWVATALSVLPVALSLLWLFALMRVVGASFNVLNVVLLPMLVGLGVDTGVHVVFDARSTGDAAASLRSITMPLFLAVVTTVTGFGSLITVHHPAIRSMGLLTAAGMTFDLVATLLVLPPLLLAIQRRSQNRK